MPGQEDIEFEPPPRQKSGAAQDRPFVSLPARHERRFRAAAKGSSCAARATEWLQAQIVDELHISALTMMEIEVGDSEA